MANSKLIIEDTPSLCWKARYWEDGDYGSPITTVFVVEHISETECEVGLLHGKVNRRFLKSLGKEVGRLGYKRVYFQMPKDTANGNLSWAVKDTLLSEYDNLFNYYYKDI